jgi:hypothetical protein
MSNPTRRACTSIDLPSLCRSKVTTPTSPATAKTIGSMLDPADPTSRPEVCLVVSHRPLEPDVIYLTKYRGQQVGERSVGLHPDIADDVAAMLRDAAAMCRAWRSE